MRWLPQIDGFYELTVDIPWPRGLSSVYKPEAKLAKKILADHWIFGLGKNNGRLLHWPNATMGHVTYPPLNLILGTLWTRNEKSRKKISRTATFEVCVAFKYNIWWQFKSQKWYLYGKKLLDSKACHPAIQTLLNPAIWKCSHFLNI